MKSRLFFIVFLSIVFLSFYSKIWDPDFFWHLNTGRWIVEHRSLPDHDPFSINTPLLSGEDFFLRSYWAAQVFYYFIYKTLGLNGFAAVKALSFVSLFVVLVALLLKKGVRVPIVLSALLPVYAGLLDFRGDRPQMFTFLAFTVLVALLETGRLRWVPLLMLIWANIHGGFAIGVAVISIYIVCGFLNKRYRKPYDPAIFIWGAAGIAAAMFNPNSFGVFTKMLSMQNNAYTKGIMEYVSPINLALTYRDYYISYTALLFAGAFLVLRLRHKISLEKKALFFFTAAISLTAGRYIPFLLIAGGYITAVAAGEAMGGRLEGSRFVWIPLLMILIVFAVDVRTAGLPSSGTAEGSYPEGGVSFIEGTGLKGNLFNNLEWGGYISWKLPQCRVIADTRRLSAHVSLEASAALQGDKGWEDTLNAYAINIIVTSAFSSVGDRYDLLWNLLNSPNWKLVFADKTALVFVRNSPENSELIGKYGLGIDKAYDQALAQARSFVEKFPNTPMHWSNLGMVYFFRRQFGEAAGAYRKALALDPSDANLAYRLQLMEKASGQ